MATAFCEHCNDTGEVDAGAPGPNDDFLQVPCPKCRSNKECLFPGCTNREGEGRFEGPICVPCAIGLRTNGEHGTDGASRLIVAAADGIELQKKILALGDEARAAVECDCPAEGHVGGCPNDKFAAIYPVEDPLAVEFAAILDVPRRHGMSRGSGVGWSGLGFWGRACARTTGRLRRLWGILDAFRNHALGVPEAFRPNHALDLLEGEEIQRETAPYLTTEQHREAIEHAVAWGDHCLWALAGCFKEGTEEEKHATAALERFRKKYPRPPELPGGSGLMADDITNGPHRVPPEVWEAATKERWGPTFPDRSAYLRWATEYQRHRSTLEPLVIFQQGWILRDRQEGTR